MGREAGIRDRSGFDSLRLDSTATQRPSALAASSSQARRQLCPPAKARGSASLAENKRPNFSGIPYLSLGIQLVDAFGNGF